MGEIVNLNRARKARDRAHAKADAAANRAAHGRTKGEKTLAEAEKALRDAGLDGAWRDRPSALRGADQKDLPGQDEDQPDKG
jgi:hypothetical protein